MNGVIDIENFLINLNEEERQGLINLLSKQKIIEFIKKNQKRFSRELAGIRVDYKSTLLQQKLLQIVFRRIEQNDKVMISFISRLCHERHMQLAKYIDEQLKEEKILARAIETRDTKMYKQIIEVVLNELDEKSTMLLFKMSGVEWKAKQSKKRK